MTELFCKRWIKNCSFLLSDREIKNSFFLIDTKVIKTKKLIRDALGKEGSELFLEFKYFE